MKRVSENVLLTVFTPAFNRAHTLSRTYESLISQSNKNFIWMIIDDGSTDNTAQLVKEWKTKNNGFEIHYIYKENGGMHTAHNLAYELIDTELNVCIDSDDKLADDAIEIIYSTWSRIKEKGFAGIIGLNADFSKNIIGTCFEKDEMATTLNGFYQRGGKGDKKLVYRTDLMKKYPPYPKFDNEKLVGLGYKYLLCDLDYKLFAINRILCYVEYQMDGSTNNMWKQRLNNPKGFAFGKRVRMEHPFSFIGLIKDTIHYIASSILAKNENYIRESPRRLLTIILIPCGKIYSVLIRRKGK